MALVVIQLQDRPDGTADVRLSTEPPVVDGQLADSAAQKMAVIALDAIHAAMADTGPKLVIVGADELPH